MNPVNLQGFQGFLLAKLLLLGELAAFHQVPDFQKHFFQDPGSTFNSIIFQSLLSLVPNFPFMIQANLLGVLGTNEIIIILVIVLLLFGGRKIPELMRGLGKGVREFNDAKTNVKREIEESANDVKNSVQ